ncbi:MAG TPA: septal ring lytic transglycosylase RlpA family protein [Acidobacteriaceae bacterium]|nr:septal ring lytic transglycosylase RlpA family protein [Acidobacteriaceae bacterium]
MRPNLWGRFAPAVFSCSGLLLIAGCHHEPARVYSPPPPVLLPSTAPSNTAPPAIASSAPIAPATANPGVTSAADLAFVSSHAPVWSETGTASWYGPPYNKRRGANGQIYDQDAMTAAHRTLPLNSLIRVTNMRTGQQAVLHVTDRGPFVPGRVLDLSMASAKALGLYVAGTGMVRIDVFAVPAPIETGGRWCVQIGAFKDEDEAEKLRTHLSRKYQTANVIEFTGPTGHWVRIRPFRDDKDRAVEIAHELKPSEGEAYLVRLD